MLYVDYTNESMWKLLFYIEKLCNELTAILFFKKNGQKGNLLNAGLGNPTSLFLNPDPPTGAI